MPFPAEPGGPPGCGGLPMLQCLKGGGFGVSGTVLRYKSIVGTNFEKSAIASPGMSRGCIRGFQIRGSS